MRQRRLAFALTPLAVILAGCVATPTPPDADPVETVSSRCGFSVVYEWDGTPGAATPADELASMLEHARAKAPELEGVESDPLHAFAFDEDPVLLRVAIRALEALVVEAGRQQADPGSDSLEVTASTEAGEEYASAFMYEQRTGGWRVDVFAAHAYESDHPDC